MGRARVTPRGVSLCSLSILRSDVTVFENAVDEPSLLTNPNVAGEFGLKFYAGAPLTTHDGFRIGTLCIIDKTPRSFDASKQQILKGLARIVIDDIELKAAAVLEIEEQMAGIAKATSINTQLTSSHDKLTEVYDGLQQNNEALQKSEAELKYTIGKLAESEELKDIAIEQAQHGIWYIDAESRDFQSYSQS
jgi:hypothetical protein